MIKLEGNFLYEEDSKMIKFNNKKIYNDDSTTTISVENETSYSGIFASILALFISGNTDEAIELFSSEIASGLMQSINNNNV